MQTHDAELRMMLKRLLARLDTTPDPHEMFKVAENNKGTGA
jgi:hypothetical protein